MRFKQINNFSQQYRTDSQWLNLNSSISVSKMNALKFQTNNQSYYFNYRTRNRGKAWLSYITSLSANDFAGWKGFPVSGLEIQVYNNDKTRIFDKYIVMFRSKVAGEWLSWISNGSLDLMSKIQSEHNLGGTLDGKSTFSGWESKGDIQAIDIKMYEDLGATDDENVPPPTTPYLSLQYNSSGSWKTIKPSLDSSKNGLVLQTPVTSMDGIILQTPNKPYYFKYRARNRGKAWQSYVLSNNNSDYAGLIGYHMTGFDIQVYENNGTRLFDKHVVMYRSKVAGEWLSWISNGKPEIMQKLKQKYNLDGNLDTSSTFSGWESKGDIQAIDIRVYEDVEPTTGETVPPPVQDTKGTSTQYRINNTWMTLTSNCNVSGMNAIKVQTNDTPYYLNYRIRGKGKGWLNFVKSTDATQFAECKDAPVTGLEMQLYDKNGTRLFDEHAVMYRSKVAGEWLSWISNTDARTMYELQQNNGLGGTLDPDTTFSGWESKGDIQAIDIRIYPNVGKTTTEGTTEPGGDIVIPTNPLNPNGKIIYIDAGHGGSDPGACNGNYAEKDYTLKLSMLQMKYLEQAGYRVMLSRVTDCALDNNFKVNQANQIGADLYIANHINAFSTSTPNGVEAYYQVNPAYSKTSKAVADKAVANLSKKFFNRGIKTKKQDDGRDWFCVLRETKMPSVLVEHCFISNSGDLAKLNNGANLDEMAKAVVDAVRAAIPNPPVVEPDPKKDYTEAKLTRGKSIIKKMQLDHNLVGVKVELDKEYKLAEHALYTLTAKISNTLSTTNLDDNLYTFSYDIENHRLVGELNFKNDIAELNKKLFVNADSSLAEISEKLNEFDFPSYILENLKTNIINGCAEVGRGKFSYSVDILNFKKGIVAIKLTFDTDAGIPDVYDDNMSVEFELVFKPKVKPRQPQEQEAPVIVYALLLALGIAILFTPVDEATGVTGAIGVAIEKLLEGLGVGIASLNRVTEYIGKTCENIFEFLKIPAFNP